MKKKKKETKKKLNKQKKSPKKLKKGTKKIQNIYMKKITHLEENVIFKGEENVRIRILILNPCSNFYYKKGTQVSNGREKN